MELGLLSCNTLKKLENQLKVVVDVCQIILILKVLQTG